MTKQDKLLRREAAARAHSLELLLSADLALRKAALRLKRYVDSVPGGPANGFKKAHFDLERELEQLIGKTRALLNAGGVLV